MSKNAKALGLFFSLTILALAVEPVPFKIYLEPQGGFESYISAAIVKKHTPVVVTRNKDEAQYLLTSAVTTKEETTGGKIARCLFVYCFGMEALKPLPFSLSMLRLKKSLGRTT
ncbi:MAG TPA: hypothetical protein VGP62_16110 [Bryobacteraceae bacterium]|jgi:hypothetical protein|nr:hypothetical protein [Bryobacteraceae bacterium]